MNDLFVDYLMMDARLVAITKTKTTATEFIFALSDVRCHTKLTPETYEYFFIKASHTTTRFREKCPS